MMALRSRKHEKQNLPITNNGDDDDWKRFSIRMLVERSRQILLLCFVVVLGCYAAEKEGFTVMGDFFGPTKPAMDSTELNKYLLPVPSPEASTRRLQVSFDKNTDGKPLEYVHIPKTGGTAVERAGAKYGISWGFCNFGLSKRRGFLAMIGLGKPILPGCKKAPFLDKDCGGTCWHQPPHKLPEVFENKAVFTVVRNPYNRIISEYYCPWFNGYNGKDKTPETLNWFIQDRINGYRNHTLDADPELHMQPQWHYVFGDEIDDEEEKPQQVDHILFYEDIDNQVDKLMSKYDLDVSLEEFKGANKGTHKGKKMTLEDLDSNSIALLNDFYGKDFDYFGYRMLDPSIAKKSPNEAWVKSYPETSIYMTP